MWTRGTRLEKLSDPYVSVPGAFKRIRPTAPCAVGDTLMDDTEDETGTTHTTEQEEPAAEKAIRANELGVVGPANETYVSINGEKVRALIDSSSQVTTVSDHLWRTHPRLRTQPLRNAGVTVTGADDKDIQVLGAIEIDQVVLGFRYSKVLALVTTTTPYRRTVPALIGTNVIRAVEEDSVTAFGRDSFLQAIGEESPSWKVALMRLGLADVSGKGDLIGRVIHTGRASTLMPGEETTLRGHATGRTPVPDCCAVVEATTANPHLGCLSTLSAVRNGAVMVTVQNLDKMTLVLDHRATLAVLRAVKEIHNDIPRPGPNCDNSQHARCHTHNTTGHLLDVDLSHVKSSEERARLENLLRENSDAFSQHQCDYGHTTSITHDIPLINPVPFRLPYRRIPPAMYEDVKDMLRDMKETGVIRPSNSPYASPIVIARKKDGTLRFCIDYRKLNAKTVRDAYPLPRIEEALDSLGKACFFSTLDLTSGYWQVEVAEEDKAKTAFTTPMGLFECNRMPFGLQNAPATFQRLMMTCLGDLNMKSVLIYLDDVIVFSQTFDEHLERLKTVFDRLKEHGLKLKPSKCHILREEVSYLGHIVSAKGVATDPEKIAKVMEWPRPTSRKEMQQFLGFCGYYRRYVKSYSAIAAPLYRLTSGDPRKKKGKKSPPPPPYEWTPECEEAFNELKHRLTSAPILGYADYSLPFILETDASGLGLGAVLSQKQGGVPRVIAYGSRGLTTSETRYPAHKLEYLALSGPLRTSSRTSCMKMSLLSSPTITP